MATQIHDLMCPICGAPIVSLVEHCPVCRHYMGAPNVRECGAAPERSALKARAIQATGEARRAGLAKELAGLLSAVRKKSGVVVTMPARIACHLASDPRTLYCNYESLLGAAARTPALPQYDRQRRGVVGLLFGTYGPELRYGFLSLTNDGLDTYGQIHCRMRNVAVQRRVTFLETNSYLFVKKHEIKPDSPIPLGHRAVWGNRHLLVAAKLHASLHPGQTDSEWQSLLMQSDGANRGNDEFIEATVYGTFNIDAVEDMKMGNAGSLDDETLLDAEIALRRFRERKSGAHKP